MHEGGIYLDIDEAIASWDREANQLFDMIGFTLQDSMFTIIWSTPLAGAPHHPLMTNFIEMTSDSYKDENKETIVA